MCGGLQGVRGQGCNSRAGARQLVHVTYQQPGHALLMRRRDGISLHTLYRKAAGKSPTLLIIKDQGGKDEMSALL